MGKAKRVVRTERIEVVDDEGRVRVVIGTLHTEGNVVGLTLLDPNGLERTYLTTDDEHAQAGMVVSGNEVLSASAATDGYVRVVVADPDGGVVHAVENEAAA